MSIRSHSAICAPAAARPYAMLMSLMRCTDRPVSVLLLRQRRRVLLMMKRKGYIVLRYMAALAVAVSILAPMLWLF